MTVTVKCQYTGIEFEAASSRSKNHPLVAKFVDEASKDRFHVGAYAKAKELLAAAKGQSDDINEIMTAVRSAFDAWCNGEAKATVRIVRKAKPFTPRYDADREINDLDDYFDPRQQGGGQIAPEAEY